MAEHKQGSLFKVDGANYLIPFILLTSLFLMWGLANNMTDTFVAAFKKIIWDIYGGNYSKVLIASFISACASAGIAATSRPHSSAASAIKTPPPPETGV